MIFFVFFLFIRLMILDIFLDLMVLTVEITQSL